MRHDKISIKWRLFLYLFGFTAILLVLLWLFQTVYLETFYKIIKKSELKKAMTVLNENISSENPYKTLKAISDDYGICILISDLDGERIHSVEYKRSCCIHSMSKAKLAYYFNKCKNTDELVVIKHKKPINFIDKKDGNEEPELNKTLNTTIKDFGNKPLFNFRRAEFSENVTYAKLINVNGDSLIAMINAELTPVDATVHTIQVQLVLISVLMLLLSIVIALLLSKKISKPIVTTNRTAKELARGKFDVEFNSRAYKEISELSNTLNYAARELGKTESLQRELISNVSHDLRTPLTMIIAYSEVMRDLPGENTSENVQVVIDEAKRLTNLVNDMLDISKLQAGVMEKNSEEYNITQSIEAVIMRYSKLTQLDGYLITFDYDQEAWVEADQYKIYQVIYNLINNAINYTGEDKRVFVKQYLKINTVRIEVRDTGNGIDKSDISQVWERYYKVDKSHKRAVMGTGLGLSIVKNILELHEAEYGVESEIGKGSTFWFELKRF